MDPLYATSGSASFQQGPRSRGDAADGGDGYPIYGSSYQTATTANRDGHSLNQGNPTIESVNVGGSNNSFTIGNNATYYMNYGTHRSEIKIPYAKGAAFDDRGQQAEVCTPGTREALFEAIKDWIRGSKTGYWLCGAAGTGKSTIAKSVPQRLGHHELVVVSFFFRRGVGHLGSPDLFVTTILFQLLQDARIKQNLKLCQRLLSTFADNPYKMDKNLEDQWHCFIRGPLDGQAHPPILLIVDAVDESSESQLIEDPIFDLLSNVNNFKGLNVRLFVTSRSPGDEQETALHDVYVLHKVNQNIVKQDIKLCLWDRFNTFKSKKRLHCSFPQEEHIVEMAERANPLFIAAMTSFKFIILEEHDLENQYRLLKSQGRDLKAEAALDMMYLLAIKQAVFKQEDIDQQQVNSNRVKYFQSIVGVSITMRESLCYESLAILSSQKQHVVRSFLRSLHAVVDTPEDDDGPVRAFHQSFPDFLKDKERVKSACDRQSLPYGRFWIDETKANSELFSACVDIMNGEKDVNLGLKQDICDIVGPGIRARDIKQETIEKSIPAALRYACRYWASHCIAADAGCDGLHAQLWGFLSKHLLHWIEAMSCLGNLNEAVRQLDRLHGHLEASDATQQRKTAIFQTTQTVQLDHADLRALVQDSRWFVKFSQKGIAEAPLQVYSSALIFTPENSEVKKRFVGLRSGWIQAHSAMEQDWIASIQVLPHVFGIVEVKFSADGERLATRAFGGPLKVWETATGELLSESEFGVTCFEISSRNDLAWGDEIGNLEVWPRLEKKNRRRVQTGAVHKNSVSSVIFSPDNSHLASMDSDGVVIVRGRDHDYCGHQLQQQNRLNVREQLGDSMISFSPTFDGHLFLAVGEQTGERCYVTIWRRRNGSRPWDLHHNFKLDYQYMSDIVLVGGALACLCGGPDELRIWKVTELDVPPARIPTKIKQWWDFRRLVRASKPCWIIAPDDYGYVGLYDLEKPTADGFLFRKFEDSENLAPLCLSTDSKLLVGRSWNAIGLWDTGSGNRVAKFDRHALHGSLSLSPDGKTLALGPILYDCELLRQQFRTRVKKKPGPRKCWDVAVSADGRFVAAAMIAESLRKRSVEVHLWDTHISTTRRIRTQNMAHKGCLVICLAEPPSLALFTYTSGHVYWDLDGDYRSRPFDIQHESICEVCEGIERMFGAFSTDGTLISFACPTCCRLGVLRVKTEAGDVNGPFYFSLSCNKILSLAPFNARSFHAVVKRNSEDEKQEWCEAVKLGLRGAQIEVQDVLRLPDHHLKAGRHHVTIMYSPSQQKFAVLQNSHSGTVGSGLLGIVSTESNLLNETYKITADCITLLGAEFCAEGRCVLSRWSGTLCLPEKSKPAEQPCICRNIPIHRVRTSPWLYCQGKPFLYLPARWACHGKLSIRNGIVACEADGRMLWLALDKTLRSLLEAQISEISVSLVPRDKI